MRVNGQNGSDLLVWKLVGADGVGSAQVGQDRLLRNLKRPVASNLTLETYGRTMQHIIELPVRSKGGKILYLQWTGQSAAPNCESKAEMQETAKAFVELVENIVLNFI